MGSDRLKRAFTPNLLPFQIRDLDRRRGHGDNISPYTLAQQQDLPVNKKPWLNKDGTHKGNNSIISEKDKEIDKMPGYHSDKEKRMASHIKESEEESGKGAEDSEHIAWATVNSKKAFGAPGKPPPFAGGKVNASPGAMNTPGPYLPGVSPINHPGRPSPGVRKVPGLGKAQDNSKIEELLNYEKKEHGHIPTAKEEEDECGKGFMDNVDSIDLAPKRIKPRKTPTMQTGADGKPHMSLPKPVQKGVNPSSLKIKVKFDGQDEDKEDMKKDLPMSPMSPQTPPPPTVNPMGAMTMKALEILKSMPQPIEKAMMASNTPFARPIVYDPDAITRNAMAIKYTPVDMGQFETPVSARPIPVYKSCNAHGLIFDITKSQECRLCTVSKSMKCHVDTCGMDLQKTSGGEHACPVHG